MEKCHNHSLWHDNQGNSKYKNNYAFETFMATHFVPDTSRKEQHKVYITMVLTFWEIVTRIKGTFEWVEQACSKS